jgi:ATP-dependent RNA helicase DDX35
LLNGAFTSGYCFDDLPVTPAYNAFIKQGKKSAKWCSNHKLNFRALSRAISIRQQLSKYLKRFDIPLRSCGSDHAAIRRCLVSGYFKNAARFEADGTYRSVREGAVLHAHPSSIMFTRVPPTGVVIYHEVIETTKRFIRDITVIEQVCSSAWVRAGLM